MATEPVGRSRIRSDEVVVPGRAIPRMCHGEEDEEWLAQRDHLVEECERAIDLFVKRWDALQRHANWDRRQGQPFVVETKNGRFTLPKRFKSRVTGVGPCRSPYMQRQESDRSGPLCCRQLCRSGLVRRPLPPPFAAVRASRDTDGPLGRATLACCGLRAEWRETASLCRPGRHAACRPVWPNHGPARSLSPSTCMTTVAGTQPVTLIKIRSSPSPSAHSASCERSLGNRAGDGRRPAPLSIILYAHFLPVITKLPHCSSCSFVLIIVLPCSFPRVRKKAL